jgi:hypothetical protein
MGGSNGLWRSALLLAALLVPGCFCGGQTGQCFGGSDDSASGSETCWSRTIGFEDTSSLRFSAADLIDALGGERAATVTVDDPAFWQALGLSDPPPAPVQVTLAIEYFGGAVYDNTCDPYLSVDVVVTLRVGDGLLERSAMATLEGNLEHAWLTVELWPPVGGDASPATVTLQTDLYATRVDGVLRAGPMNAPGTPPSVLFAGTRP